MRCLLFYLSFTTIMYVSYAQAGPRKILLKVNLGGGPVADFLGEDQVLDTDGLHKTNTKDPIENAEFPEIFQTQRFSRGSDFVMLLPVPDGIYSVTLLFAETYKKACMPGGRVFDISLGTPVSGVTTIFQDYDVFQAAGCATAHGKRFNKVPSKDGIVVHLTKKNQHPSLAGFVVEGYPAPKGDGSEYRAVNRVQQESTNTEGALAEGASGEGAAQNAVGMTTSGAPPLGGPQEVAHNAMNAGEMGGIDTVGAEMQTNYPDAALAEGQQMMKMAEMSQMGMTQPQAGQPGSIGSRGAPLGNGI